MLGLAALRIDVRGLRGGHSGVNIHEGRGNAIKLLVRALLGEPLAVALPERPYVLACAELDAATALGLDPELCGGVLNWMGSLQGHGALMCAELGIGIRTRYLPARDLVEGELVELGLEP